MIRAVACKAVAVLILAAALYPMWLVAGRWRGTP